MKSEENTPAGFPAFKGLSMFFKYWQGLSCPAILLVILISLSPALAKAQIQLLNNGNFESGSTGWTLTGGAEITTYGSLAHTGSYYLWLGGSVNERDAAYQSVTIPSIATVATLSFYYNINSAEGKSVAYDTFSATIRNSSGVVLATVVNLSNINQDPSPGNPYYHQLTFNLLPYAGQTIYIYFTSTNDSSNVTNFRIDDANVLVTVPISVQTGNATSITSTSAVLNGTINANGWNANTYFDWGSTTSYGNTTASATYGSGLTTPVNIGYTNSSLLPNSTYHFRIVSYNTVTTNRGSDSYFVTMLQSPTAPSGLTVSNVASGVSLSWQDNSPNETGFLIQKIQGSSVSYISVGPNQTNYLDTSVAQSVNYCYSVSATNNGGSSAYTPEQCTTYTLPGPPPVAIIVGYLTPVTGTTTYYGGYSTGTGLTYAWTTSNEGWSTSTNPQFAFNSPGTYWISLTVTDSSHRTSTASISINVQSSNNGISIGVALGADPVVLSSGNYVQSHVDLQIPGKGFPFEFRRFYNSNFSDQTGQPLGFGWTFNYNERVQNTGTNILVVQGDGSVWTFFPTNSEYVGEPGVFDNLISNLDGTWTLIDKNQTATTFDTNGCLMTIKDKNGNTLTCSYSGGVLNQMQDTAGRVVFFATNSYGCIAAMTDPIGRTVRYLYDANTNLIAVVDANLNTNFYNYNASHQMTNAIDGRGVCYIQNVYDPTNFTVMRQADALNNWTYLGYDFTNRVTYVTNALGGIAIHRFDENLLETNVVDESGNQETFGYDVNRDRIYINDKNGNPTYYAYDSLGNVTNKIDALGDVTAIQYDSLNNPIRRVDALMNITTFGYDSRGNLTSTTNALGFVTSVQYDASGLPVIFTDARGFNTTNQYDSQGNLTNVIDAHGFASQFVFDDVGRKIQQVNALNHATSFVYDNDDNLLFTTDALNFVTAYTYDANNNGVTLTNPRMATTTNVFDLKDRLIAVLDPLSQTNGTLYDALDRKIATFDALGNPTYYGYDNVGDLIAVTNALNQVTRFTYDPQGNQTSVIDPTGHYVTNFFDALNRKVATIDTSISTNSTTYDALGRVSATTNANGQPTQFFYDAIGRLTNVIDSASQSVFFAYDENGNRIQETDPNGHTWTRKFDELNRLIEEDDPDANKTVFSYDPVGNLTNNVTANGDSINYSYDPLNRLLNIVYPTETPVTFAYDSVGNRTNMTDSFGTTAWQIDLLNRLLRVTDSFGQTVANGFDANGNRISLTYPGNKVVNYGFDALNRMTSFTNWLNGVVTYAYRQPGKSDCCDKRQWNARFLRL